MPFRPDPAAMSGVYETTETSGPTANFTDIRHTAPIFGIAVATDLAWALRAMDASDEDVPPNLVQTSPGLTVNRGDPEDDRRRIIAAAERNRHHLDRLGYTYDEHGIPVPPPANPAQSWMHQASSLGPMTNVPHEPAGPAG